MSRQPEIAKVELVFEDPDWDTFRPSMWKRMRLRYKDKKLSATLIQTRFVPMLGAVHYITFEEEEKSCQY